MNLILSGQIRTRFVDESSSGFFCKGLDLDFSHDPNTFFFLESNPDTVIINPDPKPETLYGRIASLCGFHTSKISGIRPDI